MDKPLFAPKSVATMGTFATIPQRRSGDADDDPEELPAGFAIDHFEVIRLVGRGGMGEVYLARDTTLGRKVAIKLIHSSMVSSRDAAENFLREARATARFNHPHIVTIYATGEVQGRPFVALEYLEGDNLRWRLVDGPLGLGEGLRVGLAVAEALTEAHSHGVLHRDLKPDNVVMPSDGRLRVVDFGLARMVASSDDDPPLSGAMPANFSDTSATVGTPGYMAPETWLARRSTTAVDIWAFGALMFELLSGELPYSEDIITMAVLRAKVISSKPVRRLSSVVSVPPALDDLLAACLEKDLSKRPSAANLVIRLRRLMHGDVSNEPQQESPFRGLLPFGERHARHYFGRSAEIASFVELARTRPVLPIVGPSGAGKTSFALAGIVPRLREQGYQRVMVIRPGATPFRTLAARLSGTEHTTDRPSLPISSGDVVQPSYIDALAERLAATPRGVALELRTLAAETNTRVLLVIDQLEELFTLCSDTDVQRKFMDAICSAADDWSDPMRVIFTVRDDYLGRIATSQAVRVALSSVTVLRAPDNNTLVSVLERTAEAAGYHFEDSNLAREMVAEVSGEATSLPLLQFAARRLWELRNEETKTLLRASYVEMGGVAGALATQADGVLESMAPQQLLAAKRILLRLVTPQRTRRVSPRDEALTGIKPDVAEEVLGRLVSGRLVTVRKMRAGAVGTLLELAHESLINNWLTLSRWVLDNREDLAMLSEVEQAAQRWEKRGRKDAELWQTDALHDAHRLLKRAVVQPSLLVRQFLERGEELGRARRLRQRALLAATVLGLAGIMLVLYLQRREADFQRDQAIDLRRQTEEKRAESLRESARAALGNRRPLEARAKLRSSLEIDDSVTVRGLWWQLERDALQWQQRLDTIIYQLAFSPDGRHALAAAQNRVAYLIDVETKRLTPLRGHSDQVAQVAFFPNGKRMVSGSWDGDVIFWDVATQRQQHVLKSGPRSVQSLRISKDGATLITAGLDGIARVWSTSSYKMLRELDHGAGSARAEVSPDGRHIVTVGRLGNVTVWRMTDGEQVRSWKAHDGPVTDIHFNRKGDRVLTASADATAKVFEFATGKQLLSLEGHEGLVRTAAYTSKQQIVTASRNGGIRVYGALSGELLRTFDYETGSVHITPHPDGERVMASSLSHLMLWRIDRRQPQQMRAHRKGIYGVSVSPDGNIIATGSYDHNVMLWDAKSGEPIRTLTGHTDTVHTIKFSHDSKRLFSTAGDGKVFDWDVKRGVVNRTFSDTNTVLYALALSPDATRVAAGGDDRRIYIWDTQSGQMLHKIPATGSRVHGLSFSSDGSSLFSASFDPEPGMWDVKTGRLIRRLKGASGPMYSVTASEDFIYGAAGGALWMWDTTSWQTQRVGEEPGGRVYQVQPFPQGGRIVSAASTGVASVWSTPGGKRIATLHGHVDELNAISLDKTGSVLATAGDDGTVRLWNGENYRPIWRAPALMRKPLRLLNHRGWTRLDSDTAHVASAMDKAIESDAQFVSQNADASIACVLTYESGVSLWHAGGHVEKELKNIGQRRMLAVSDGCLFADDNTIYKLRSDGSLRKTARRGVVTLAAGPVMDSKPGVLAVLGDQVVLLDEDGGEHTATPHRWQTQPGVTAAAYLDGQLIVGFRDGHLHDIGKDAPEASTSDFLNTPSSPVVNLVAGPGGTVIAGYANGFLGLWDPKSGGQLGSERLHGPIAHLVVEGTTVHVAAALGQHVQWDLSAFDRPYCDLLGEVWKKVAVVWQSGTAVAREPDVLHPCLAKTPTD